LSAYAWGASIKTLDVTGVIQKRTGADPMKTTEEIIAYLETELAAANEMHDLAQDKLERMLHLIKASTIARILEEIKR
jgi:hypothetical protein